MMPQLNDFLSQSGMSLPEGLIKKEDEDNKSEVSEEPTK
jgi:hypothetical protein